MSTDNELLQIVGANIRMLRHYQSYSQDGFAKHIGMDRSYLGIVERGGRNISILNLIRIAKGLGVEVGELFKGI